MRDNSWIITLTGDLGSGKGTVSEIIKRTLNFKTYSTGDVQRQIAARYNMTTLELNKYAETHPEIDEEVDGCFTALSSSSENLIVDSRMAWHFLPDSFKVYLRVDIDIAVSRIMNASRGNVEVYSSLEEAKAKIVERKSIENKRYMSIYNVDCANMSNFDLMVDSSNINPETIANAIIENARIYFENKIKG